MERTGLKPTDAAWLAGIFDGEGCVLIKNLSSVCVCISNTDLPMLEAVRDLAGGKIRLQRKPTERNLPCWEWYAYGPDQRAFIEAIRPYARVKAPQLDVASDFPRLPPRSAARQAADVKLRMLKKVNYHD